MGRLETTTATKVSRQAQRLPLTAPSGPDWKRLLLAEEVFYCFGMMEDLRSGSLRHGWYLPVQ
jgi:hypothetical protein